MSKPSDIVMMDAVALSRAIHTKKVSCADVMGAYLDDFLSRLPVAP